MGLRRTEPHPARLRSIWNSSGLHDRRPKLLKLLGDPTVHTVIAEHRERLASLGVGMIDTMLQARGGTPIVIDDKEVPDDVARDMTEILTCFCARLDGKRAAANRADGQWKQPMTELKGKKRKEKSSCPKGWLLSAIVVELELTPKTGRIRPALRRNRTLHLQSPRRQRPDRTGLQTLPDTVAKMVDFSRRTAVSHS